MFLFIYFNLIYVYIAQKRSHCLPVVCHLFLGLGGGVAAVVEDKGWRPFHDVTCQPLPIHGWLYNIMIIHARFNSSGDSTITDDLADVTVAPSASAK